MCRLICAKRNKDGSMRLTVGRMITIMTFVNLFRKYYLFHSIVLLRYPYRVQASEHVDIFKINFKSIKNIKINSLFIYTPKKYHRIIIFFFFYD